MVSDSGSPENIIRLQRKKNEELNQEVRDCRKEVDRLRGKLVFQEILIHKQIQQIIKDSPAGLVLTKLKLREKLREALENLVSVENQMTIEEFIDAVCDVILNDDDYPSQNAPD